MMTTMLTAIVLIDSDAARIPEVAAAIADLPGVSEVYSVTGEVDLIAMVRVREHDDLADVIADKVSKIEGVLRTQTYIAFRTYSQHDLEQAFASGWRTDRRTAQRAEGRRSVTRPERSAESVRPPAQGPHA